MNDQQWQGPFAQIKRLRQPQTYQRVLYVLLALPLGIGYWLLLVATLVVDLLFVPRFLWMVVLLLVQWLPAAARRPPTINAGTA